MAHHGGGVYCNADIFVKCGYFYTVLISPLFPIWHPSGNFGIRTCKYSLLISNPNILYSLIVCQNVVNYPKTSL